jgi:hypothetical protein
MAVDASTLTTAAAAAETAMNALLDAKAAPATVTLEQAISLSTAARTALDALTTAHTDFQNDAQNQGGSALL